MDGFPDDATREAGAHSRSLTPQAAASGTSPKKPATSRKNAMATPALSRGRVVGEGPAAMRPLATVRAPRSVVGPLAHTRVVGVRALVRALREIQAPAPRSQVGSGDPRELRSVDPSATSGGTASTGVALGGLGSLASGWVNDLSPALLGQLASAQRASPQVPVRRADVQPPSARGAVISASLPRALRMAELSTDLSLLQPGLAHEFAAPADSGRHDIGPQTGDSPSIAPAFGAAKPATALSALHAAARTARGASTRLAHRARTADRRGGPAFAFAGDGAARSDGVSAMSPRLVQNLAALAAASRGLQAAGRSLTRAASSPTSPIRPFGLAVTGPGWPDEPRALLAPDVSLGSTPEPVGVDPAPALASSPPGVTGASAAGWAQSAWSRWAGVMDAPATAMGTDGVERDTLAPWLPMAVRTPHPVRESIGEFRDSTRAGRPFHHADTADLTHLQPGAELVESATVPQEQTPTMQPRATPGSQAVQLAAGLQPSAVALRIPAIAQAAPPAGVRRHGAWAKSAGAALSALTGIAERWRDPAVESKATARGANGTATSTAGRAGSLVEWARAGVDWLAPEPMGHTDAFSDALAARASARSTLAGAQADVDAGLPGSPRARQDLSDDRTFLRADQVDTGHDTDVGPTAFATAGPAKAAPVVATRVGVPGAASTQPAGTLASAVLPRLSAGSVSDAPLALAAVRAALAVFGERPPAIGATALAQAYVARFLGRTASFPISPTSPRAHDAHQSRAAGYPQESDWETLRPGNGEGPEDRPEDRPHHRATPPTAPEAITAARRPVAPIATRTADPDGPILRGMAALEALLAGPGPTADSPRELRIPAADQTLLAQQADEGLPNTAADPQSTATGRAAVLPTQTPAFSPAPAGSAPSSRAPRPWGAAKIHAFSPVGLSRGRGLLQRTTASRLSALPTNATGSGAASWSTATSPHGRVTRGGAGAGASSVGYGHSALGAGDLLGLGLAEAESFFGEAAGTPAALRQAAALADLVAERRGTSPVRGHAGAVSGLSPAPSSGPQTYAGEAFLVRPGSDGPGSIPGDFHFGGPPSADFRGSPASGPVPHVSALHSGAAAHTELVDVGAAAAQASAARARTAGASAAARGAQVSAMARVLSVTDRPTVNMLPLVGPAAHAVVSAAAAKPASEHLVTSGANPTSGMPTGSMGGNAARADSGGAAADGGGEDGGGGAQDLDALAAKIARSILQRMQRDRERRGG